MDNTKILNLFKKGFQQWNKFRESSLPAMMDLSNTDFRDFPDLGRYDFSYMKLVNCQFDECNLIHTKFENSDLTGAWFTQSILWGSTFLNSSLVNATLFGAELDTANFDGCDLTGARMNEAKLMRTQFKDCTLSGCSIYGVSVWGVELDNCKQANLRITLDTEPDVTVDNLEVAQFIYLLLNSKKVRHVIDTITSKVVLILGRFTPQRLEVLHSISDLIRKKGYLPVIFNFEKPVNRDVSETVSILASLSRFVIADITDARSIPQELMRIVPFLPSVPVFPILGSSDTEYGMFEHFKRFNWVQPLYNYSTKEDLHTYLLKKAMPE